MSETIDSSASTTSSVKNKSESGPLHTPLYAAHVAAGGKMVDFSGWDMPVNYGSQIDEHVACRSNAVVFDVSHMTVLDLNQLQASSQTPAEHDGPASAVPDHGSDTAQFLSKLLANDIAKTKNAGDAIYSCMLDEQGGIIDDLIAYWRGADRYRLIVNAGTREKDLAWIKKQLPASVEISERKDLALLAVQGPTAVEIVKKVLAERFNVSTSALSAIKRFSALDTDTLFVARTGYTGEDGFEIAVAAERAPELWHALLQAGVQPAGLGARDTLRLESAMNLYGNDMDESVTPLESGIAWTVAWNPPERPFIGRAALQGQRDTGSHRVLTGLLLDGRGVLRRGQTICVDGVEVGQVTSGTFSPTLQKSIALARVETMQPPQTKCQVMIRNKPVEARFVTLPFVKNGEATFE